MQFLGRALFVVSSLLGSHLEQRAAAAATSSVTSSVTKAATTSTKASSTSSTTKVAASTTTSSATKVATSTTASAASVNLVIQTVFTAPTSCSTPGVVTQVAASGTFLWDNIISPASNIIATNCYPSQFVASALATSSLKPFQQLICPANWNSYPINSTYIICCPGGFQLFAPNITNSQRPGTSAWCLSSIWPGVQYDVTSYNNQTIAPTNGTMGLTATGTIGTWAWATAFEGTKATTTFTSANSMSTTAKTSSNTASTTKTGAGTGTTSGTKMGTGTVTGTSLKASSASTRGGVSTLP